MHEKIEVARRKRSTAKTNANEVSSRSHAIFHIQLQIINKSKKKTNIKKGTITIVDLAGSERHDQSNTEGERLYETKHINKSLSSLQSVIKNLSLKKNHIPYRDSKLTNILQDYLGKDSKTLVIVNVSPCSYHSSQTLQSLKFADTMRSCKTNVVIRKQNIGGCQLTENSAQKGGQFARQNSAAKSTNLITENSLKKIYQKKMEEESQKTPGFRRINEEDYNASIQATSSQRSVNHPNRLPTIEANKENASN